MWRKGNPSTLSVGTQIGAATMENSMEVSQKIKIPNDPEIALLGINLKKVKTLIQKDTCTPVFRVALITIAKVWKQPKCPSTDEWRTSLAVQWLRLCASTAGGEGLIPGRGIKIPHAGGYSKKKKEEKSQMNR